uniref:RNA-dependent RNA polymerase n=1 Tax=Suillus luteus narnavirus 6 TaxID=3067825 RepID=A0AA49X7A6_9VIRU|nr:RNA-dependent RNA polymerase [Suillus luteus narnavirus 6]
MTPSNESGVSLPTFDINNDVLSTKGFPLTSVLRTYSGHKCQCHHGGLEHKNVFDFNRSLGSDLFNQKIDKLPKVEVCWNSSSLFEEKLPRKLTSDSKERFLFEDLQTVNDAVSALYRGTYWCHRMTKGDTFTKLSLFRLLSQDLDGKDTQVLGKYKLSKKGVGHLRNILSTVDGLAIQICLAFPDIPQIQNWDYFDNMSNGMLKNLLSDWTTPHGENYTSFYEKLKTLRGQIKELAFHEQRGLDEIKIPRELSFMRVPISLIREKTTRNMFRISLLIQTRACGTPPPHVFLKTYRKFRETVTSPCSPPKRAVQAKLAFATKVVYERIVLDTRVGKISFLDEIKRSLTRAKISLSDSAELNTAHKDGGKYEAFRRLSSEITGKDVQMLDLENGTPTGVVIPESPDNIGTRAFHHSLGKMLRGEIVDLMTVRSESVLEPGKVREITVSDIHHAVLLHPISHILLDVLAQVPSSAAGVKAANHAFEFYKRLNHKNPRGNFIFDDVDLWVLSSDLETATDFANPYIVRIILQVFLGPHCLGIPKLYRLVVTQLLTEPRLIVDPHTNEDFMTTRGCLMGDPVTKFVMHMMHLVGKEITTSLFQKR